MEITFLGVHWLRPLWLLTLIPLFILSPLIWRRAKSDRMATQVIAPHLAHHLVRIQGKHNAWARPLSVLTAVMICIVALAGPAVEKIDVPAFTTDRGAVLLFDASIDTRAQDVVPDRHTRLRFKAVDLVNRMHEGQLGLVAYAGDAFTVTPLTRDNRNILQSLTVLEPEVMPTDGNYPLLGFEEASRLLQAAGYRDGDIFWFTGGIQQRDMDDIRRHLRDKNWRVHILAVGTPDGAPIRGADGELVRDPQGRIIIPRLIPDYLQTITRITGGRYQTYTQDHQDVEQLIAAAARDQTDFVEAFEQGDAWRDLGPWIALLLVPFALYAARRGVVYALPIVFVPLIMSPTSHAAPPAGDLSPVNRAQLSWLERMFLTRDQQAQRLQTFGDYASAADVYQSAEHRALAHYRAGQYAEAAALYSELPGAHARFNQGNALAQLGEFDAALDAYQQALSKRPDWQEAQDNYTLIKALRDQQPQGDDASQDDHNDEHTGETDASNDSDAANDGSTEDERRSESGSEDFDSPSETPSDDHEGANQEEDTADESREENGDNQVYQEAPERLEPTQEELDELNQLLRRVDEDPALILRNRLQREAQRRRNQTQPPPRGF